MNDAIAQLCELILRKLEDAPEADAKEVAAQVQNQIAVLPDFEGRLQSDPLLVQINRDGTKGFQTIAQTAFVGGAHFHVAASEKLACILQAILDHYQSRKRGDVDFRRYLNSISTNYQNWWQLYTPTNAVFSFVHDFDLMVTTLPRENEKPKLFRVLEGVRQYLNEYTHLLLVGRPGSGKSTAMARLLLETAKEALENGSGLIPVLVELRYWQTGILERVRAFLGKHDPDLDLADDVLSGMLRRGQLLLLIDGVNELPSDEARTKLAGFRTDYPRTQMIFTTRGLGPAVEIGIQHKIEMKPLDDKQMLAFIKAYTDGKGPAPYQLREMGLGDLCETPLFLWMICEVSRQSDFHLPPNLGGVFDRFVAMYEEGSVRKHEVAVLKGDVRPLSDRRLWKSALKALAMRMMQGSTSVDIRLTIGRDDAETIVNALSKEQFVAHDIVDDLLKYHLLHNVSPVEFEFRHQLIQEYYSALTLLGQLASLDDETLKHNYLNYLKWTVPLKIVTSFIRSEQEIERLINLAHEVDLGLERELLNSISPEVIKTSQRLRFRTRRPREKTSASYTLHDFDPKLKRMLEVELRKAVACAWSLVANPSTSVKRDVSRKSAPQAEGTHPSKNLDQLIAEIDSALSRHSKGCKLDDSEIASLREAIEELGQRFKINKAARKLLELIKGRFPLARRFAAFGLTGFTSVYRPRPSGVYRTPQQLVLEDRKTAHAGPLAFVGWLALLTDRHVDIRAEALKMWECFPPATSIPIVIGMLRDRAEYHDEGEDRRKEYVYQLAQKALMDFIERYPAFKVAPFLPSLKRLLRGAVKGYFTQMPGYHFYEIQELSTTIQARCRYYNHDILLASSKGNSVE